jgi:chemotaxis response regulator CheB
VSCDDKVLLHSIVHRLMPIIRVLLVEDYEPMRQTVRATLQERRDLHIVGEASDGLQAVKKAVELKPDLILMDI